MAANSEVLGGLHALFAEYWAEKMRMAMNPNLELRVALSSADAAVIRAFLKDNGIQADPSGDKELSDLAADLKAQTKGIVPQGELDAIMSEFQGYMNTGSVQ
jgi:hypothetical protein